MMNDSSPSEPPSVERAASAVRAQSPEPPTIGVVLGSGLGGWTQQLSEPQAVPYPSIPGMPLTRVPGHAGALWLGRSGGARVACLAGRVHAYEGHPLERVVFGVRLLAALGCRAVLLTNAAGGIRSDLGAGCFMLVTDHLNLSGRNPLVGVHGDHGPPFVDMTTAYDLDIRRAALRAASRVGVTLAEGVYAGVLGPSYETPAEIRMLRALGADAVGMSTVSEVIALRERGVPVGAVSCITNAAAGLGAAELSHDDVQRTAAEARARFEALLSAWVAEVAQSLPESLPA